MLTFLQVLSKQILLDSYHFLFVQTPQQYVPVFTLPYKYRRTPLLQKIGALSELGIFPRRVRNRRRLPCILKGCGFLTSFMCYMCSVYWQWLMMFTLDIYLKLWSVRNNLLTHCNFFFLICAVISSLRTHQLWGSEPFVTAILHKRHTILSYLRILLLMKKEMSR